MEEGWHRGKAGLECGTRVYQLILQPFGQSFRPVEAEDGPAGGVGLEQVGKAGLDSCGLVEERERTARRRESCRNSLAILLRLDLDANEGCTLLLSLDDPESPAVSEEEIIRLAIAARQGEFADGNPATGVNIGVGPVLDEPSCGGQHAVDGLTGLFFRRQFGLKALAHQCMTSAKCGL